MRVIDSPRADTFYKLGYSAGIDDNQINDLYRQIKSVYHDGWEKMLEQKFLAMAEKIPPDRQKALRDKAIIAGKITRAIALVNQIGSAEVVIEEAALDTIIVAVEKALNIKPAEIPVVLLGKENPFPHITSSESHMPEVIKTSIGTMTPEGQLS